ncbi:MAG: AraC family transcriptional regulator [Eubacteriales bacterium]|nr:AraC family transcriptional regulator [Eubacteriales bacterium]
MEWIAGLNRVLRYVEEHLTDPDLSVETLSRVGAYSSFYLQRVFYILTEISLSDYIRQRRLSMAGQELQATGAKVIDVALKYGYETPESFQKAFRRFHGVTPSAAQRSRVQLRYINPLQIQVKLTGGSIMDYSLETLGGMTVIGLGRKFNYEDALKKIPGFWDEYYQKGLNQQVPGMIGVCFDNDDGPDFTYLIGSFCEPDAAVPEGFEKHTIAPYTWAKFRAVGPMPDALQKVNRQIFTEWLPNNSDFDLAEGVNIEYYTEGDMQAKDYESEIWLPVRAK